MKNKLQRFMILVIALTVVSLMLVSGTYAKYTTSATGSDTATVAKWSIKVNDTEMAISPTPTVTFNLFSTIKEADGTSTEEHVATGKKIAPGTGGSFALAVENASEVTAEYSINLAVTNAGGVPIEFSTDGTTWKSTADVGDLSVATTTIAMGASATTTVYWRWAFTGAQSSNFTTTQNEVTDTALGIAARTSAAQVQVNATITATQVD